MAKLIAQSGHSLDLPRRRVTLGESPSCDIPLAAGLGLASRHFEIEPAGGGNYIVRDVSGGAGLLLNGVAVQEHILEHGNVLAAGALRLGFWNTDLPKEDESPFLAGARRAAPEEALPRPATEPAALPDSAPVPDIPGPAVAALAPMNPSIAPPPAFAVSPPAPSLPPLAGPPVAWVNPATELPAVAPPRATASGVSQPAADHAMQAMGPRKKSLTDRIPRRVKFAGRRVAIVGILGALAGGGFYAWRLPKVQEWMAPLVAKFNSWTNPTPAPRPPAPPPPGSAAKPGGAVAAKAPDPHDTVTPKAEHNDVVKRMLTERTVSLFQADLRQLVTFYNAKAADRSLPPQREMTEAFRKNYGIRLDGFDLLTCIRARGKDEFVFVLTSPSRVDIENVLGIPPQPVRNPSVSAGKKRQIRIYPVRPVGKLYGVAQYDPFTVILGNHSWIDTALNGSDGPALREAMCMFPDNAARMPGALIMVERINGNSNSATALPFQTAVSNLFFKDKGESRLTLTRNPDVKEETFVQQSSDALKAQFKALHQAVKLSEALTTQTAAAAAKAIAIPQDAGELITTTEASIAIPDGEALLREAIDSVAHTFMSQSPSVELILAAQKAVLSFNQARLGQAPETQSVNGVAEALELLQNGIAVTGVSGRRDTVCQIERLQASQTEEIVHLLSLEEGSRLVFRPNTDRLSGNLLELAVKARDYRNAELIISLWTAAKFSAADATDANTAVRKVLEWANGPGARQRLSVGLPSLTADEYKQASALLSMQNGQLTWRPGEEGYRTWLRKVSPDPKADAKKIAGIYTEAKRAGAIPTSGVSELSEAVRLLNTGVRAGSSYYSAGNFTVDELRAAARYLSFDGSGIKFVDR